MTRNNGSAKASLVMLFKLAQIASRGWRKLRGHQHIPDLIKGVNFIDGVNEQPHQRTIVIRPTTRYNSSRNRRLKILPEHNIWK